MDDSGTGRIMNSWKVRHFKENILWKKQNLIKSLRSMQNEEWERIRKIWKSNYRLEILISVTC